MTKLIFYKLNLINTFIKIIVLMYKYYDKSLNYSNKWTWESVRYIILYY